MSDTDQRVRSLCFQNDIPEYIPGWGSVCWGQATGYISVGDTGQASPSAIPYKQGPHPDPDIIVTSGTHTTSRFFVMPSEFKWRNSLGIVLTLTEADIVDPTTDYYIESDHVNKKGKNRFRYNEPLPTVELLFCTSEDPASVIGTYTLPLKRTDGVLGSRYYNIPVHDYVSPISNMSTFSFVRIRLTPVPECSIQLHYSRLYYGRQKQISGDVYWDMTTGYIHGDGIIEFYGIAYLPDNENLYYGYINLGTTYDLGEIGTAWGDPSLGGDPIPDFVPNTTVAGSYFYIRFKKYSRSGLCAVRLNQWPDGRQRWDADTYGTQITVSGAWWRSIIRHFTTILGDSRDVSIKIMGRSKLDNQYSTYDIGSYSVERGFETSIMYTPNLPTGVITIRITTNPKNDIQTKSKVAISSPLYIYEYYGGDTAADWGHSLDGLVSNYSNCSFIEVDPRLPVYIYGEIGTLVGYTTSIPLLNETVIWEFHDVNVFSLGDISVDGGERSFADILYMRYEDGPGYTSDQVRDKIESDILGNAPRGSRPVPVIFKITALGSTVFEYNGMINCPDVIPRKYYNFVRSTTVRFEFTINNYQRNWGAVIWTGQVMDTHYDPVLYPDKDQTSEVAYSYMSHINCECRCMRYGNFPGTVRAAYISDMALLQRDGLYMMYTPYTINLHFESQYAAYKAYVVVVPDSFVFDQEHTFQGQIISEMHFSSGENLSTKYITRDLSITIPAHRFEGRKRLGVMVENGSGRGFSFVTNSAGGVIDFYIDDAPLDSGIQLLTKYDEINLVLLEDPIQMDQLIYLVKHEDVHIFQILIASVDSYSPECTSYGDIFDKTSRKYKEHILPASDVETFSISTPGTFNIYITDFVNNEPIFVSQVIVEWPNPAYPAYIDFPRKLATFEGYDAWNQDAWGQFYRSNTYGQKGEPFDYVQLEYPTRYYACPTGSTYWQWRTYEQWLAISDTLGSEDMGHFNSVEELIELAEGAELRYAIVDPETYIALYNGTTWIKHPIEDLPDDDPDNEGKKTVILDLESVYADTSVDCPCIKFTLEYDIKLEQLPKLVGTYSTIEDLEAAYPEGEDLMYAKVGIDEVIHVWDGAEWVEGTIPEPVEIYGEHVTIPDYAAEHQSWIDQYLEHRYTLMYIEHPGIYKLTYTGIGEEDKEITVEYNIETIIDEEEEEEP